MIIAIACILAYFPTLSAGFLADDFLILYKIKHGTMSDIGADGLFFRPLVVVSFAIDSYLFGNWAPGFHIINLALHFAASLGVAACARIIIRRPSAAIIAGLVFALHPIHPEAVSWIAGRYDAMCGAFLAWALYCHLRLYGPDANRPRGLRLLSLILFALACFSKEMAFSFPLVIVLYELIPVGNINATKVELMSKVKRVLPFFIVAAVWFVLRWIRLGGIGGYAGEGSLMENINLEMLYHLLIQPFILLFIPANRSLLEPAGMFSVIAVEALLIAPLVLVPFSSNRRTLAFCVAAIILSLLPTAHLGVSELRLEASRFLYTPSIFFALFISALLTGSEWRDWKKKVASILAVVYLAVLLLCVCQNNHAWGEAGRLVRIAARSADELIERREGEWGTDRRKLHVFNVPTDYLGALTFINGLPYMLRLSHDDELKDVEIEVLFSGSRDPENLSKTTRAIGEGAVVWMFNDITWAFAECEWEQQP